LHRVSDLQQHELEAIVESLREFLFLRECEDGRCVWDLEKECSGADLVDLVGGLLEQHGLVPSPSSSGSVPCIRTFVLYDFDAGELASQRVYSSSEQAQGDAAELDNVMIVTLDLPTSAAGPNAPT